MKSTREKDAIPPKRKGQLNMYKPSDIKRWGTEKFLAQVVPRALIQPNFNFTKEEQPRMDELLGDDQL